MHWSVFGMPPLYYTAELWCNSHGYNIYIYILLSN